MRVALVLPVVGPLFVAALLVAGARVWPRRLIDAAATGTALAAAIVCVWVLDRSMHGTVLTWFGGWEPRHGVALGISFVVDPVGAGIGAVVAALTTTSLLFSWRWFRTEGAAYHALMLVFMGAMIGFAFSGDLFNLFVFFELMGVAAYALTGYEIDEAAPIQGALNFAVVNTIGGFALLIGIALLYARTGALNLAQVGRALAGRPADRLVIVAFVLLLVGFLVKGAIVPFHFWLADAHAVAPSPVCALLSGVMVELGLYAVARLYWTVFTGTMDAASLGTILTVAGVLTAVVGSAMCLMQRHLKRLLAFSTVAHAGLFLVGIALLSPAGLAGMLLFALEHALLKAALFLCAGIVLHRLGGLDLGDLRGRGKAIPATGILFTIAGVTLAGLPILGQPVGKGLLDAATERGDAGWLVAVFWLTAALTAGAILRAASVVFWGRGHVSPSRWIATSTEDETTGPRGRTPWTMIAPVVILVVAGLACTRWTAAIAPAVSAASTFVDRALYAHRVLASQPAPLVPGSVLPIGGPLAGLTATAGALAVALVGAGGPAEPRTRGRLSSLRTARSVLHDLHSGHVGDYVAWLTIGAAVLASWCLGVGR